MNYQIGKWTLDPRTYFDNRPALEVATFSALWNEFQEEVAQDLHSALPFMSFIMLKPDAYLRGLGQTILQDFADRGITVAHGRIVHLQEGDIDKLYMFVKQKYYDTWWVMKRTYTLASCVPVLIVGNPQDFAHLSERARAIVGATTPVAGNNDQIRYKYRATHRVFNLIHGTDDPASAIREARVFFSWDDIRKALRLAQELRTGGQISPPEINLDLPIKSSVDLRFSSVKCSVKGKINNRIKQIVGHLDSANRILDPLRGFEDTFAETLLQEQRVIDQNLDLREERRQLVSLPLYRQRLLLSLWESAVGNVISSVARAVERDVTVTETLAALGVLLDCISVLRVISDDISFGEAAFDRTISKLHSLGIDVSSQDEVILHTGWAVATQEFRDFIKVTSDE